METERFSYDQQARTFDARAGLSDAIAARVAEAIVMRGLEGGRGHVLEIGAGTGEIGRWLVGPGRRYVGIDSSRAMLDEFRARAGEEAAFELLHCDANGAWPVKGATVALIFGSRVFHLLDTEHVVREISRVADPRGATLMVGRIARPKDSMKALMRRKMRELLAEHGVEPRATDRKRRDLLERTLALGGELLEPFTAARWKARHRPLDSIEGWRGKESIGGVTPAAEVKEKVLAQLAEWATRVFGSLERELTTDEKYVLEGVRLSGSKESTT